MGANVAQHRKWMSPLEAAEKLAGFERGEGVTRTRNPETRRKRLTVHDDVSTWRRRLWEAMQAGDINYSKDETKAPNSSAMLEWLEVERWAKVRWPSQRFHRG